MSRSRAIRDEIEALEAYCAELIGAIDEFEHDARRCRDRLERVGGQSHRLSRDLKRLEQNRDFNRRELADSRRRMEALRGELEQDP